MRKKRGINQLMAFLLLGSIAFSNVFFYRQPNPKDTSAFSYEVRIGVQNKSSGLDVGKAY